MADRPDEGLSSMAACKKISLYDAGALRPRAAEFADVESEISSSFHTDAVFLPTAQFVDSE